MDGSTDITPIQLIAEDIDVAITTLDYVEESWEAVLDYPAHLQHWHDLGRRGMPPKRPACVFGSTFWRQMGITFKRLVIDEAHLIKDRNAMPHRALKEVNYEAVILLTGTPAHQRFTDVGGQRVLCAVLAGIHHLQVQRRAQTATDGEVLCCIRA